MNIEKQLTASREYKSNVFSMLFKERSKLLHLYNALNESHYTDEKELEIVTLENAIYLSMKNDLAFLLDCRLYLYEHQSTPNPNMPLRDLIYVTKEYEKLISLRTLYARKKVGIPAPHFIVFYNGQEKQPERQVLKLSDLYYVAENDPMLELKVLMLNINHGYNESLKNSCKELKEYMQYVDRVRMYSNDEQMNLKEAVERAITECIREGILEEFLRKNRGEVVAMSIFEFDAEREWKLIREAEYEYGREDGLKQGLEQGLEQGLKQGRLKLICKKLRKGKTVEVIAEELEEEIEVVRELCDKLEKYAPEYEEARILQEISI